MTAPVGTRVDVFPYPPIQGEDYGLKMKGCLYVCPFLYDSLKDPDTFDQTLANLTFIDLDTPPNETSPPPSPI